MRALELFVPPPPAEKPTCPGCRTFAPECLVPAEAFGHGGAPVPMCWLCAHAVTEHGAGIADAADRSAACSCRAEEIFPLDVLARRRPLCVSGEVIVPEVPTRQGTNGAKRTASARLARRRAVVHANRSEAPGLPQADCDSVDRVVTIGD